MTHTTQSPPETMPRMTELHRKVASMAAYQFESYDADEEKTPAGIAMRDIESVVRFQIQQRSYANAKHDAPRSALGIHSWIMRQPTDDTDA